MDIRKDPIYQYTEEWAKHSDYQVARWKILAELDYKPICGVESLCFLPTESQAALVDLGNIVDAKMSRLKSDSELETARFRQAVYIEFCKNKNIPDPCGSQAGYERIVACFI